MISSTNEDGLPGQLEALRQRLLTLYEQLIAQPRITSELQTQIIQALRSAVDLLQTIQQDVPDVDRLRTLLHDKDVLLREIHHRVKNNLQIVSSLLDLQTLRTSDPTVQELLRKNQSRIRSIALVHERLYQSTDLTELDLGEYLRSLATLLVRTYAIELEQVRLRTEVAEAVMIRSDRAVPLGLILNELVANALEHGLQNRSGEITVQLTAISEQQLALTVSNTGSQFPVEIDLNAPPSLGLQLIQSLVQQIDGELSLERGNETTIQIRFSVSS